MDCYLETERLSFMSKASARRCFRPQRIGTQLRNQLLRNLESAGADAKAASMAETAQMLEVHPGLTRPGAPFSRPSSGLLRSCQTYPALRTGLLSGVPAGLCKFGVLSHTLSAHFSLVPGTLLRTLVRTRRPPGPASGLLRSRERVPSGSKDDRSFQKAQRRRWNHGRSTRLFKTVCNQRHR